MMSVALTVVSRAPNLSLMLFILIKSDCACFKTCLQTVFFLLYIDHFTSHTKFTLTKHSYSLSSCKPNFSSKSQFLSKNGRFIIFFRNQHPIWKVIGYQTKCSINLQRLTQNPSGEHCRLRFLGKEWSGNHKVLLSPTMGSFLQDAQWTNVH